MAHRPPLGTPGVPQIRKITFCVRGVHSPTLANIYLHYAFDLWAERWRHQEARGNVILVRYADDILAGFEHQDEAERFQTELRGRLEKFALSLHPDKTRLIEFGRHAAENRKNRGLGKPATFHFLGFTHICGRSRAGRFLLKRKTRRDRMRGKLKALKAELRRRMHAPIPEQGRWLAQVVRGYFAYHAVPTNTRSLAAFRYHVTVLWHRALRRRSQKDWTTWERISQLVAIYLPPARVLHPWPQARFAVKHPRWEPGARIAPAGICAGGVR
jgi:RNA-directed DNA polymerase